jgi:GPH family glycoside/pentoside/hexuronide:cation symporter
MAFWAFFATLASLAVSLYPMATQWEGFGNPITGARWVAAIVAVVIFAGVGIIPALVATERFNKKANNECQIGFLEALKQMVSSKPLLLITMVILGLNFCGTIAGSLAQYIAIYYVMGGDVKEGIMLNGLNGVGFSIIGFAGIAVVAWLGTHLGKRRALQLILALATVGGVAKWFIFTPSVPYLLLLDSLLSGPLWVAIGVLVPAMMADLCDADELDYGERREGLIGAVFTWITKVGLSLTFLFSGFVLQFSGFDASVKEQPGDTLTVMRLCFAGASVIAPLVGIVCLHFYSITEERAYKVRALLEQRRGKL